MTQTRLLNDAEVARFLCDGYLLLPPDTLSDDLHQRHFEAAVGLYDDVRRLGHNTGHLQYLGDNLLARVPSLTQVLQAPVVHGALTSLLGDGYALHPSHFVHSAGRADQGFHQDGNLPWNARGYFRSPRPIALMLFYYPQAVSDAMGPTEVLPGTQYWSGRFETDGGWHEGDSLDREFTEADTRAPDLDFRDARLKDSLQLLPYTNIERRRLSVPAGSVLLAHYDLVHRGTRQAVGFDGRRFMYKFYFLRTSEPRRASWNNRQEQPDVTRALPEIAPVIARVWSWLRGAATPDPSADVPGLLHALHSSDESTRRAAGYALGDAGAQALQALATAAVDPAAPVRRMAVFALGETRCVTEATVAVLVHALRDADSLVRSNAAFALGSLARVQPLPASAIDALLRGLDGVHEPDNTNSAGLARSTVRECIAQALLMAACNTGLSEAQLLLLAQQGLGDSDRYVRGIVTLALTRAAAGRIPDSTRALIEYLSARVFNALPAA